MDQIRLVRGSKLTNQKTIKAETPISEHKDLTQLIVDDLKNALHNAEEMLNEM